MNEKIILCFGDSNTWGFVPGVFNPETWYMERYPISVRWPGIMRNILGDGYHIIEEGLNGRTTNVEYPDINGRSGTCYIIPCLYSHSPLDIVIVQLGINDLKNIFNRDILHVSTGISEIIDMIKGTSFGPSMQSPPKILLVSPPPLEHEEYVDENMEHIFKGAKEKSFQFHDYYSKIAESKGCHYLDLGSRVKYSLLDGIHLDADGHQVVGLEIATKIKEIFSKK